MIDDYTRLLGVAAESNDPKIAHDAVVKLVHHLRSVGRVKMLPSIAHELRKIQARRKALASVVEVAHKEEEQEALQEAARIGIVAKRVILNSSLLSGWRAMSGGRLVDRSGKRALIDMYTKITT